MNLTMPATTPLTMVPQPQTMQMMQQQKLQMVAPTPRFALLPMKINTPGANLTPAQNAKITASAKQFEGVFMTEMIKPMFETVKTDQMFGGGEAENTYKGLLTQQYGKEIAGNGGLGIAKYVKDSMIKLQEGANK